MEFFLHFMLPIQNLGWGVALTGELRVQAPAAWEVGETGGCPQWWVGSASFHDSKVTNSIQETGNSSKAKEGSSNAG